MPLANTSMPVPALPALGAWNVALQHMERAGAELASRPAAPVQVPGRGADLALENVNRVGNVAQLAALSGTGTLPAVATSAASSDMLSVIRVLQAGTYAGGGDRWLEDNAHTAIGVLASASASLSIAPDAAKVAAARTALGQAADAYGLE